MSHNIYGERFYSLREKPWHGLGIVSQDPVPASIAFERAGAYDVRMEPVYIQRNGTLTPILDRRAIVNQDGQVYEVVSERYGLITPKQFCTLWDESVTKPVETLGALGQGETFFLSTKLPSFSVGSDDEVEVYLLACNPMTGRESIHVLVTPVRVVCQNTLMAALSAQREQFRIVHSTSVAAQLHVWLEHVYGRAVAKSEALAEAFQILSHRSVTEPEVQATLATVYPLPTEPSLEQLKARGASLEELDKTMLAWERATSKQQHTHMAVQHLFEGNGRGSTLTSARGTAFGLYNAVVEYEDFGRPVRKNTDLYGSMLTGERADVKQAAYAHLCTLAR